LLCDEHVIGGDGEYCGDNDAQLDRINVFYHEASSQVKLILSPKQREKNRSKQNKDMRKYSNVYSERGVPLPVLTSGGE
jgi:hypothetical protein